MRSSRASACALACLGELLCARAARIDGDTSGVLGPCESLAGDLLLQACVLLPACGPLVQCPGVLLRHRHQRSYSGCM